MGQTTIITRKLQCNYRRYIIILANLLWAIYALVTSVIIIRFMRNILKITSKTKSNTVIDYKNAKLVLVKEKTLPHTFLNYYFHQ